MFGTEHGVKVLQGEFLKRIIANFPPSTRLSEEDFCSILKTPCVVDSKIEWRKWLLKGKAILLESLNFDGCNNFLVSIKLLLDEYLATSKSSEAPIRLLYIFMAYFLICLDYTSRTFSQFDTKGRATILTNGFRYGEAEKQSTEEIVQMALHLLSVAGEADLLTYEALRREFDKQISEFGADILGEYFAKPDSIKNLFLLACSYEEQAYSSVVLRPHELPSEQKATIGLICDFFGLDRKRII